MNPRFKIASAPSASQLAALGSSEEFQNYVPVGSVSVSPDPQFGTVFMLLFEYKEPEPVV